MIENNLPMSEIPDTREKMINAALSLFGQVGYAKASTRAISEAAGVNEVTLFRHFGSKKNLLMACMQQFNQNGFTARFVNELSGNYAQDISIMARMLMDDTAANIDLLNIILCEARNFPELREAMLSGGQGNLGQLTSYFRQQIDAGQVRAELDPEVLAAAFSNLFSANVLFELMLQGSFSASSITYQNMDQLVDLFVNGTILKNRK